MFDCLKHEDVKAINENKEPSKYQLGKLVPCNIQFESGKPKEIGYLFPFDPTSGYRKIEISGCQREFVYKVTVMENTAPCDDLAQPVFDDLGQEDFATADLVDVFEKVKETPQDWLDWMANRKKTRTGTQGRDGPYDSRNVNITVCHHCGKDPRGTPSSGSHASTTSESTTAGKPLSVSPSPTHMTPPSSFSSLLSKLCVLQNYMCRYLANDSSPDWCDGHLHSAHIL